jgi:hypothetical protein
MSIQTLICLRSPSVLKWWEWGNIIGAAGLLAVAIITIAGYIPHPVLVALTLHVATDFTFQSPETALRKRESHHFLLIHALAAGGLPLAAAGLIAGNSLAILIWTAVGVTSHYALDWTGKFGLRQVALAAAVDQTCHTLTILVLVLAGSPQ